MALNPACSYVRPTSDPPPTQHFSLRDPMLSHDWRQIGASVNGKLQIEARSSFRLHERAYCRGPRCIFDVADLLHTYAGIQHILSCKELASMLGQLLLGLQLSSLLALHVAADPICSSIFGNPGYNDCALLVAKLYTQWPNETNPSRDRKSHFLSLPGAEIPSWVRGGSRYQRVDLPLFARPGESP